MTYYIIFWFFFMAIRAIHASHNLYKKNLNMGYNPVHLERTGEMLPYTGETKERIFDTIGGALGLLFSPFFLLLNTCFFLPAAGVLYLMNQ